MKMILMISLVMVSHSLFRAAAAAALSEAVLNSNLSSQKPDLVYAEE